MQRKIRVLVGKPGLDGHDRGAKVVAAALRDAGMEVIYTGLHQTPEQVVEAAIQEDVDVVALSILSGAHMTLFPEVLELMRQRGIGDRLLTGGGIIPPEDMDALAKMGVGRLFGPGASTGEIVESIRGWFIERHGRDALAPAPSAAAPRAAAKTIRRAPSAARAPRKAPASWPGKSAAARTRGRAKKGAASRARRSKAGARGRTRKRVAPRARRPRARRTARRR